MKKNKWILSVCLMAIMAMLVGCQSQTETEDTSEEAQGIPVSTTQVTTGSIGDDFTYMSTTKGQDEYYVMPELNGEVTAVYYDLGDYVEKNAVLYSIDYNQDQINLQLAQANQAMQSATLAYEDAKENYEDSLVLYSQGAISKSQMDQMETMYENAGYAYDMAQESYQVAEDAAATVEDKIDVKSPASGYVAAVNVAVGNFASPSSPAFTIVDLNKIRINLGVTESIISQVEIGDDVKVYISSLQEAPFYAKVLSKSPSTSPQTGKYQVDLELDNENSAVLSGMNAKVMFTLNEQDDVIVIPAQLVNYSGDDQYVFIAVDDTAVEQLITTGIENDGQIQVTSGLSTSDYLITEGYQKVQDGDAIEIVED